MESVSPPVSESDAIKVNVTPISPALPSASSSSTTSTTDTPGLIPLYAAKPDRCSFFLKRKMRYCTVPRLPDSVWCGNHQHLAAGHDDDDAKPTRSKTQEKRGGQRRLPCPLDPKHTVYERELNAHLKVCNVKKEMRGLERQQFYRVGANSGAAGRATHASPPSATVSTLTVEEARALFAKARHLASEKRPHPRGDVIEQLIKGPVATKILASIESNNVTSEAKARHVIQQASLVSHLNRRGLLYNRSTCVEMGAGRGTLGQAVHLAFPQARVMLVERSGVKFKADAPFRRTGEGSYFERYRLDIRDLWIKGLPLSSSSPSSFSSSSSPSVAAQTPPLVFMGKHVCGVATDLSLRAIANFLQAADKTKTRKEDKVEEKAEEGATTALADIDKANGTREKQEIKEDVNVGVVIATCCYHVCNYDDYVGMETWENELKLTRADFEVAQKSACWVPSLTSSRGHRHKSRARKAAAAAARTVPTTTTTTITTTTTRMEAEGEGREEEEKREEEGREEEEEEFASHNDLSREEKIEIGWACKRLIDYGRLQFLRASGLEAECVVYCEPDVSPENSCILAWSSRAGEGEERKLRDGESGGEKEDLDE